MRKQVSKPYRVKAGDLVIISMRLRRGQSDARLSLFSALDGDDLSPHMQHNVMGIMVQGRPPAHPATYVRLTSHVRKATWSFIADEDLRFVVIQDVDKGDPLAKARIRAYGTFGQTIRRFIQNTVRFCSRRSKTRVDASQGRHSSV